MTQATPISNANPTNSAPPQPQQQQSLLNQAHLMSTTGNGMQLGQIVGTNHAPSIPTTSIIHQQLTNNNTNPIQAKQHQNPYGMNSYVDPLEHTLASLEQPQMNNNSQKNPPQDMNAIMIDLHKQQLMLNHLAAPHMSHGAGPNGFGTDFNGANGAVNNLMNMLVLPQMDPSSLSFLNSQIKNVPGRFPDTWNNLPGNNPMAQQMAQQQQQLQQHQQHAAAQHQQQQHQQQQQQQQAQSHASQNQQHQQPSMKQEKIMLTPKPIEELLMNPNDKAKGHGGSGGGPPFGQAFNKYEQNLKNASSWSQLAAAGSPQNPGASISSKSKVPSDTFQEYRTKAKEQAQRQKQEQEKMKKQKEQELKRQQETLQKHKSDDLSNGHRFVN